jgi:hypothetical protein
LPSIHRRFDPAPAGFNIAQSEATIATNDKNKIRFGPRMGVLQSILTKRINPFDVSIKNIPKMLIADLLRH